jgi:hypothetical protein
MNSKRIVALKLKCPGCGREVDYVSDAKYWEGQVQTWEDLSCRNCCCCKSKLEVTREVALKNVFVKEGAVL